MKLFCKHEFVQYDELPCTFKFEDDYIVKVPITLLECKKCGKRKVIRSDKWYYDDTLLAKVELWRKGQFNWEKVDWNG